MKLRSVSVYGLFRTYDYSLEFFLDGLTFIHSKNGFGKSTIVRMIYELLKGDIDDLRQVPFDRIDLGFEDGINLIVENRNDDLLIQMQRNEVEEEITPDELSGLANVTYISPERIAVKKLDGRLVSAIDDYSNELSNRLRYAKEHTELAEVANRYGDISDDELVNLCKDLKAKLDYIWDAGLEADMPSNLRFPPSRYDLLDCKDEYVKLANSVADFVDRNHQLAESVVVFQDIVNGLLENKDLKINDRCDMTVVMGDGTHIPLQKLSSGEKHIIIIFYRLLFHVAPGSIVIIDEPEISLHVSWQQRIGTLFSDLCRLRDLQMIIATHSPSVIHEMWDRAAELRSDRA